MSMNALLHWHHGAFQIEFSSFVCRWFLFYGELFSFVFRNQLLCTNVFEFAISKLVWEKLSPNTECSHSHSLQFICHLEMCCSWCRTSPHGSQQDGYTLYGMYQIEFDMGSVSAVLGNLPPRVKWLLPPLRGKKLKMWLLVFSVPTPLTLVWFWKESLLFIVSPTYH